MKVKFTVVACVTFMVLAFIDPASFVLNARNGMMLFSSSVLPVLFPFFLITGLLIELDLLKKGKFQKIGLVVLSYLAGYPTSARMIAQLYNRGEITRSEAIKTAAYTSTQSPIFIIATVGVAIYQDVWLGVIIFAAHVLGAIANGVLYSFGKWQSLSQQLCTAPNKKDVSEAVASALNSAVQNILAVGGLIVVFFIASAPLGVVGSSLLEMTTGIFRASEITNGIWRAIIPCAIVSFGGLCVAMQGFVFLKDLKMPIWFYFIYKITHTIISIGIVALLYVIFV